MSERCNSCTESRALNEAYVLYLFPPTSRLNLFRKMFTYAVQCGGEYFVVFPFSAVNVQIV